MWRYAIAVMLLVGIATRPARADDIPPELEMAIDLKILSFDAGLKDRAGDAITIAIVHTADHKSAASAYVSAINTLADKNNVQVHGKKVRAIDAPIAPDLSDQLAKVSAIYVVSGASSDQVAAIGRIGASKHIPTLTSDRSYLSNGIAIAVVEKDGKPGIIVHAGNAKDCGMMLDSKLLRLAEVIK
jgi:hypothetical protein